MGDVDHTRKVKLEQNQELERYALEKPQGRLQDVADLVVPDSVLTHEHNCREFVLGGFTLAERALRLGVPVQSFSCRGEVFYLVGEVETVIDRIASIPNIPPPPDPNPDEGWDDEE